MNGLPAHRTTPKLEDQVICSQSFLPLAFDRILHLSASQQPCRTLAGALGLTLKIGGAISAGSAVLKLFFSAFTAVVGLHP